MQESKREVLYFTTAAYLTVGNDRINCISLWMKRLLNEPFAIAVLRYFGLIVDEYRIVNETHKCHLGRCYVNQAYIV